jgi:hypothetical protein
MSRLTESLEEFRGLHRGAKAGTLGLPDKATYHAVRDELARLLLSAQHIALLAGQRPRRSLRGARSLLVELDFSDGAVRAMTLQLSSGGFAALLASAPKVGEEVRASLRLPGGRALQGRARVVAVKEHLGNTSTSFQFVGLGEAEAEYLEMLVFDALFEQFE